MQAKDFQRDAAQPEESAYELSDLNAGYVGLFGIGLAVVLVIAVVVASLLIQYKTVQHVRRDTPIPQLAREREATPGTRLQVDAQNQRRQMRAAEDAMLNSYGWVDKDAGIVRIPVDRAMEILAKKGLPARKQEEKTR
ncbi:MAG TPA: hypothetical protein VLJ79_31010 [Candidatus Binatia bacterium]|jgi:hypothetical protein|nr:hypothetical protein [Candidatus Binatia bacterium]